MAVTRQAIEAAIGEIRGAASGALVSEPCDCIACELFRSIEIKRGIERRYRRLEIAYQIARWTGYGWQALAMAWPVIGIARGDSLAVAALHWLGCIGLSLLHSQICFAAVRAQSRLTEELIREADRLDAVLPARLGDAGMTRLAPSGEP